MHPHALGAGRNDIAASMAAAEQEEQPVEATISSIVSTPLGKMARATSPKKPLRQQPTPGGAPGAAPAPVGGMATPAGATPTLGMLRRLSALHVAATPPLASASRHPQGSVRQPGSGGGGALLAAPEGETSRVVAAPELLPVPYTQRLQLPAAAPAASSEGSGGEGQATMVAASGAVTSAGDPEVGDGMESLAKEVGGGGGRVAGVATWCRWWGMAWRAWRKRWGAGIAAWREWNRLGSHSGRCS